jgi:5-methylcytosine-specific restriction endonuclease McrA
MKWTTENVFKDFTNLKGPSRSTVRDRALTQIDYKCGLCGNTGNWWGLEIQLELHHINGNPKDNRIENLVFMCPNCHSLTEGFRGRN